MTTQKPRLWVGNCGKEGKSPHGLRDNSPLSGETMGNQKRGVSIATDQSPKGAPALPRRLANRFLEVLPRGAKGFCRSIYLSIYLQFSSSTLYQSMNVIYIYLHIADLLNPIASIIIPISRWFHSCEACKVPDLRMMSQLSQLESELQEPEISLWCRTAGRSCVFCRKLMVSMFPSEMIYKWLVAIGFYRLSL